MNNDDYTSQPNTHSCPGHCGRIVRYRLLACDRCWPRLPEDLQTQVVATFWGSNWDAHSRALTQALAWYAAEQASGVDP